MPAEISQLGLCIFQELKNRLPDCLSRVHLGDHYLKKILKETENKLECVEVLDNWFEFEFDW